MLQSVSKRSTCSQHTWAVPTPKQEDGTAISKNLDDSTLAIELRHIPSSRSETKETTCSRWPAVTIVTINPILIVRSVRSADHDAFLVGAGDELASIVGDADCTEPVDSSTQAGHTRSAVSFRKRPPKCIERQTPLYPGSTPAAIRM
jgi:hypothetical protein